MATQSQSLQYAEEHLREIARKSSEAEVKLLAMLQTIGDLPHDQARALVSLYIRKKMVKLDLCNVRYTVAHGRYLDADFVQALAIETSNAIETELDEVLK